MSTLSRVFRQLFVDLRELLLPNYCAICGRRLRPNQTTLCSNCFAKSAFTGYSTIEENPMAQRVRVLLPYVKQVSALVFYMQYNGWRDAIHRLKYGGRHYLGVSFGEMLGADLASSPLFEGIDFVVAVPLHPLRRVYRGYNQSYYIARSVARELGVPCRIGLLRRLRYNVSQVRVKRSERWRNAEGLFGVRRGEEFEGRRVLLIDDVFTTGATTLSCAEAIHEAAPSCEIYIATLAVSWSEFGTDGANRR